MVKVANHKFKEPKFLPSDVLIDLSFREPKHKSMQFTTKYDTDKLQILPFLLKKAFQSIIKTVAEFFSVDS